jgi:hypothetical protein
LAPVIEIEFDRPLDSASVTTDNVSLRSAADDSPVPATVGLRGDRIIRLAPIRALAPSTAYYYELSTDVRDQGGIAARALRRPFVTVEQADLPPTALHEIEPREVSQSIAPEEPIVLRFEALNPLSVTSETIHVSAEKQGAIPVSISFDEEFRELILTPLAPVPADAKITLTASGLEDALGHAIQPRITYFSTGPVRAQRARPGERGEAMFPSGEMHVTRF